MKIINKVTLLPLIVATMLSCSKNTETSTSAGARPALQVVGYKVVPHSFANDITATANLLASEQVELKAPLAGMVLAIYFKEGQQIREGQSIIRLDDRVWRAQLSGLNSELRNCGKRTATKKRFT